MEHDGNCKNSHVCVGAFEKLSGVTSRYPSPGLDIIMSWVVCGVHYCYDWIGEIIHILISHRGLFGSNYRDIHAFSRAFFSVELVTRCFIWWTSAFCATSVTEALTATSTEQTVLFIWVDRLKEWTNCTKVLRSEASSNMIWKMCFAWWLANVIRGYGINVGCQAGKSQAGFTTRSQSIILMLGCSCGSQSNELFIERGLHPPPKLML